MGSGLEAAGYSQKNWKQLLMLKNFKFKKLDSQIVKVELTKLMKEGIYITMMVMIIGG